MEPMIIREWIICLLLLIVTTSSSFEYYYYEEEEDFGGYGGGNHHHSHHHYHQEEEQVAEPDYYADLGISKTATAREIKKKYRMLALELHPDKQKKHDLSVQERFEKVQAAYEVLSNPEKRDAYDDTGLSTFTSRWDWVNALQRRGKQVDSSKGFFKDLDLITQFTPSNLNHFYHHQRDPFIVDFYAPWCSHCLDVAPAIRSVAISLDAENSNIKVGAVNCEQYGDLCGDFNIHSYPTLQIFYVDEDGNRQHDKSASHNPEELMQWIKRTTESKVEIITRHNFNQKVLRSSSLYIISFTAGHWCGPCMRFRTSFKNAAFNMDVDGKVKFGQINCDQDKRFCQEFDVGHYPYLIMYGSGNNKVKEKYIDLNIDHVSNGDILNVIERILPIVILSSSSSSSAVEHDDL